MSIDLRQLLPEPRMINLGRGTAPVYGLNIAQLSSLLVTHSEHIQRFLSDSKPDIEGMVAVIPELSVKLIAMGLRCEGQEDMIEVMPLAVQVEVLMDIWELSVPDAKKLKARLAGLSEGIKSLAVDKGLPSVSTTPSPTE